MAWERLRFPSLGHHAKGTTLLQQPPQPFNRAGPQPLRLRWPKGELRHLSRGPRRVRRAKLDAAIRCLLQCPLSSQWCHLRRLPSMQCLLLLLLPLPATDQSASTLHGLQSSQADHRPDARMNSSRRFA